MTDEEKRVKRAVYARERYLANKDEFDASNRRRYAANKGREAARRRERDYGITQDQFDGMMSSQKSACAICDTKEPKGRNGVFHVDHCHSTQRVRGLLCHNCNIGLGYFKDTPAALRKAASYLEGHA